MKKTLKCGIAAAVFVAAGIAAYQSYGSYGVQDNSLLMQNIEALASGSDAEGESDPIGGNGGNKDKKKKKTKYYGADGLIKCPKCNMGTGFTGVVYGYQKNGNLTSYKEGRVGKEVVCTPYCGKTTNYSEADLVTRSCI